jgi:leucyl/phenylalanyl-tRNA--protein transferase
MTITEFPPVTDADEDGLLAFGGDLEVESLLQAYRSGIFPWPIDKNVLAWFSPPQRAVLFLDELHISHSLKKEARDPAWKFSMNSHFEQVIELCAKAKNRKKQRGTWITPQMIAAYKELYRAGYAFSAESLYNEVLAGGIYGTCIDGNYAGESMFYNQPNASKLALVFLISQLKSMGVMWIDFQVLNPFTESLGAREIERDEFLKLLAKKSAQPA